MRGPPGPSPQPCPGSPGGPRELGRGRSAGGAGRVVRSGPPSQRRGKHHPESAVAEVNRDPRACLGNGEASEK